MLILRNVKHTDELLEKKFSSIDGYSGNSNSGLMFLLKVFLMHDLDNGGHVPHWINTASANLITAINKVDLKGFIPNLAISFLGLSFESERKRYLSTLYEEFEINSPFNYAKKIIYKVQNQSVGRKLKYASKLRSIPDEEVNEIIDQLRYMAMCLDDQIDEDSINWWDINPSKDRIEFLRRNNIPRINTLNKRLFNILCKVIPALEFYNILF